MIARVGRKWAIIGLGELSREFPTYKTKKAAYEVVTTLILREAHDRAEKSIKA